MKDSIINPLEKINEIQANSSNNLYLINNELINFPHNFTLNTFKELSNVKGNELNSSKENINLSSKTNNTFQLRNDIFKRDETNSENKNIEILIKKKKEIINSQNEKKINRIHENKINKKSLGKAKIQVSNIKRKGNKLKKRQKRTFIKNFNVLDQSMNESDDNQKVENLQKNDKNLNKMSNIIDKIQKKKGRHLKDSLYLNPLSHSSNSTDNMFEKIKSYLHKSIYFALKNEFNKKENPLDLKLYSNYIKKIDSQIIRKIGSKRCKENLFNKTIEQFMSLKSSICYKKDNKIINYQSNSDLFNSIRNDNNYKYVKNFLEMTVYEYYINFFLKKNTKNINVYNIKNVNEKIINYAQSLGNKLVNRK